MTVARKLYNFPDKNLDRQIIELVYAIDSVSGSGGLIVPDLTTGIKYTLTVEVTAGVPQLVLTQI